VSLRDRFTSRQIQLLINRPRPNQPNLFPALIFWPNILHGQMDLVLTSLRRIPRWKEIPRFKSNWHETSSFGSANLLRHLCSNGGESPHNNIVHELRSVNGMFPCQNHPILLENVLPESPQHRIDEPKTRLKRVTTAGL
jgi:hypothetical protein